ncbi:PREDICTED: adhesion G protein-coupled receptor F5-like isoform X2 [Poecilia mexicana]|uniref:adhesion G protein-coupled receptor F5-like isoform X2 n=1 Tax=Poecilia mexicana TaxID=48701 RepID=UPI00072E2EC6|nr:PREDICTED: adhesion G protein-coupled receptor F5-like isoform X2 [Poecilia mexicana]
MALPKAIRLAVVLLVICCALDKPGFRHSVSVFFEELMAVKSPSIHVREKRETFTNVTDYEFQVILSLSELEILQTILNNLSFPITINSTSEISNIDATTVCSRNISGYQCVCEENFAWSYNSCITYGVCDAIDGDTCGCINELPADGQFCQLNSSQTVPTQTPSSTTAQELVDFDVTLDLHIPLSGVPDNILELIRSVLGNETFPATISQSLEVKELLLTTACSPNSTDTLLCDCEDGFSWPCDKCNASNSCSDISSQTCTCIYGLPSDNEFCQPITNNSFCPTPNPVLTTMTTAMPSTTTPSPPTTSDTSTILTTTSSPPTLYETSIIISTTSSPPTPYELKDIDIVLDLHIPFSNVPPNILDLIRTALENETFPVTASKFVEVIELNLTTACSPNATDGLRCECEDGYAWPCDMCNGNNSCKDVSSQTCTCKYGLLPNEEFCQPNTDIDLCPTSSPAIQTTTTAMATTTPAMATTTPAMATTTPAMATTTSTPNTSAAIPTTTSVMPTSMTAMPTMEIGYPNTSTPSSTYVELYVLHELFIPVASVEPNIVDLFIAALKNESFPVTLTSSLKVIELNITTVCHPNSTYGLECKCEDGFGWPCEMCNSYNSCSSDSSQTCTCIYEPSFVHQYCQPITDIALCPVKTTTTIPEMTTVANATTPEITVTNATTQEITVTNATTPEITVTNATTPEITVTNATTPEITVTNATTPEITVTNATTPPEIPTVTNATTPEIPTVTNATTPEIPTVTKATSTNIATVIFATTLEITVTNTSKMTTVTTKNMPTVATTTVASVISRTFTLNMDFETSYNNKNSTVYKDIHDAITTKCQELVSKDCTVKSLTLRRGSTIADYTLISSSGDEKQVDLAKDEMLNQLAAKYPVDFVSVKELTSSVNPKTIIAGVLVTLTCGPPPTNLGSDLTVEWTRSGNLLATDKPSQDRTSKYTIPKFLKIHDGTYVCKVKRKDGAIFTQSLSLTSKAAPQITVNPVKGTVQCGGSVSVQCSVNSGYQVQFKGLTPSTPGLEIKYDYKAPDGCTQREETITCQVTTNPQDYKIITLELIKDVFCKADGVFSAGSEGFEAVASCEKGKVGNITAVCKADGKYGDIQDNCVLEVIQNLLNESEALDAVTLPAFLEDLKSATINNSKTITDSPATISAMVKIFANIGRRANSLRITISKASTQNILESAGILTTDAAKDSWNKLNNDNRSESSENKHSSSSFLSAFEGITPHVVNEPLNIVTQYIIFTKINFTNNFQDDFNSSVEIDIPEAEGSRQSVAVILFASMDNVLPARQNVNTSDSVINGRVVLIQPESDINNISIVFDVLNETLGKPKCVFWDFNLLDDLGGWSDEGCSFVLNENGTVRCSCNHTTSFSILMSPDSPQDPVLDFITYIGIGISMGSLVVCLIIEGIAWRKIRRHSTSYLRHVSIVNIAVSLLIADIWFIIGAAISNTNSAPACTAATFFIHFFYLALFFWMLASALLLLYRTLSVFDGGLSKLTMLIIGFSLGYGAPLIIATITIASTAPSNEYIRENVVCWLNWNQSKALLAFVIPALLIVVINLIILIVVLYKILSRRGGANASQAEEKHVLYVIARSLAVLTPLFGLTWGLGVGVLISPKNRGMHITFALFNSVQGFFILVFGTLLDKTVRSAMTKSQGYSSQSRTRSTRGGTLSSGVSNFFNKLKKPRRSTRGYHTSSDASNT